MVNKRLWPQTRIFFQINWNKKYFFMKYKLQFLVSLFLYFIITTIGFAQYITNGVIEDGTSSNLQGLISSINNDKNSDIEGSPYINETYQLAKISLTSLYI